MSPKALFEVFGVITLSMVALTSMAQTPLPSPILPDAIRYISPPGLQGIQVAQILGDPKKAEPYLVRVKLAAGARIPPHTHPDARSTTVLAGTLHVGFGEKFDESKVVAIPAGGIYVAPAGVPHYVWARDGDALYQEAGTGPTAVMFVKPR